MKSTSKFQSYSGKYSYIFALFAEKDFDTVKHYISVLQESSYRIKFDVNTSVAEVLDDPDCGMILCFASDAFIQSKRCMDDFRLIDKRNYNTVIVLIDKMSAQSDTVSEIDESLLKSRSERTSTLYEFFLSYLHYRKRIAALDLNTEKFLSDFIKIPDTFRYRGIFGGDDPVETIEYPNGDVYDGAFRDGKRHGKGYMLYADGDSYFGSWEDDKKCGHGITPCFDGQFLDNMRHGFGYYISKFESYRGEWKNDKRCGVGAAVDRTNTIVVKYEGEFKDDLYNGHGILYSAGHKEYDGEFLNGMRHGTGKAYDDKNNLIYDGEWENDKRSGNGKEYSFGQLFYEGGFSDGRYSGKGKLYYNSGALMFDGEWLNGSISGTGTFYNTRSEIIYTGGWEDDAFHGQGTLHFKGTEYSGVWEKGYLKESGILHTGGYIFPIKGKIYIGELKDGKKNGEGRMYTVSGELEYDGQWMNNSHHGFGILNDPYGYRYEGEFRNGRRDGYGKYLLKNGETYEGQFEESEYHGYGVLKYADGKVHYDGEWEKGKFNGFGKDYYPDGTLCYSGNWINDRKWGYGKWYYPNGKIKYDGEFAYDEFEGSGTFYTPDGKSYAGTWYDNYSEEHRLMHCNSDFGRGYYIGETEEDGIFRRKNGYGLLFCEDGHLRYNGDFLNDDYSGFGTLFYPDGKIEYDGEWKKCRPHGYGILNFRGKAYEGEWKDGVCEEHGICFTEISSPFDNPKIYIGEIRNGEPNGSGTMYLNTGEIECSGIWKNGTLIKKV